MAEATNTGGGGGTMGVGMATGILSIPFQRGISNKKKKQARLQRKHQALLNANARENLKQEFINTDRQNVKDTMSIEQDSADRGIGDSSIKQDNQTERQFSYDQRKAALQRERAALESGIFTGDKLYKLQKKIASAQNAINMINAVSGGASGVVDYYGSGGPQG